LKALPPVLTTLMLSGACAALTLLMLEVGLRLLRPQQLQRAEGMLVADEHTVFAHAPGFRGREVGGGIDVPIEINSKGLRDREIPYEKPAGVFRILVLGDSWTFGSGVAGGAAYPKALERLLEARIPGRRFEVINAGVSAYGTYHELAFFEKEGLMYSPDLVVLGFFAANDINDNSAPRRIEVSETGELVGRNSRRGPLDGLKVLVRLHSHLYRFLGDRYHRLRDRPVKLDSLLWGVFADPYPEPVRLGWARTEKLLLRMAGLARANGAGFMIMSIPRLYQVSDRHWRSFLDEYRRGEVSLAPELPGNHLNAFCAKHGIEFLDLLPGLRAHPDPESLYQGHWTVKGNQAAAALLLDRMASRGLVR